MRSILLSCFIMLAATAMSASAAPSTIEFSADTIESHPQQGDRAGKLYIGNNKVRTEYEMNGKSIIQIIDLDKQEAMIINPAERTYMRTHAGQQGVLSQDTSNADKSPCAGMQNLTCKAGGIELVNGRKTRKWEITSVANDQGSMQFWLDEERRIPVRQIMPDGSSMEARMLGTETVNGRSAEKWEMTAQHSGGKSSVSYQWFDPELNMIISEEQPDGFSRKLINIKRQTQPAALFAVPAGYKEISMPQGGGH